MAWSLGTGVPLLGILVIAAAGLIDPDEDPTGWPRRSSSSAAVGLGVGCFAITVASRSVAEPIAAVRRAMARVEEGDYDARVPVDDGSEVGLLEAGFNSMAAGLRERERLRDLFGRHVGREVAEAALEREGEVELGGELREVAVRLRRRDRLDRAWRSGARPHEVVALLNRFFSIVVEVVEEHGGWVNKFEGDAALCVFGAPSARPDAAGDALRPRASSTERLLARAGRRDGRDRRVGRPGGGRQRRRRGALRVHRDRRSRSTRRRGCASWPSSAPSACSPPRPCCAAPTPTRRPAGSCATRSCCAGASRRHGWRHRCACEWRAG